ncbi:MAG: T9SS type A sorting domain-containing protein [Bacteroidota bacterium]|jgi:hypothetical protein
MKAFHYLFAVAIFLLFPLAWNCHAQKAVGIALLHDSTSSITIVAGTPISFVLRATDDSGRTVANWDYIGRDVALEIRDSHAETDTSRKSWGVEADGYSWMTVNLNDSPLALDSTVIRDGAVRHFLTVPRTAFTGGQASLTFTQSGADSAVVLSLSPRWNFLRQTSPPIRIQPDRHSDYLVDITCSLPDSDVVFLLRRYEVLVTPRDRFTNPINGQVIPTRFTAHFPSEFDQNAPGLSDIFNRQVPLTGQNRYYLSSRIRRHTAKGEESQWIDAWAEGDTLIRGRSVHYQILDHAPYDFPLLSPLDNTEITLWYSRYTEQFIWGDTIPRDPYSNILISRFDSSARGSDDVHYTVRFLDAISLTRSVEFESDDSGRAAILTLTHGRLDTLIVQLTGIPTTKKVDLIWMVEATDGLYVTESRSVPGPARPGFLVTLTRVGDLVAELPAAAGFSLEQNFPNPFSSATTLSCDLRYGGSLRLRLFNLIGESVATIHDGYLPSGKHRFRFDGSSLPAGIYTVRLDSGGDTIVRRIILLR